MSSGGRDRAIEIFRKETKKSSLITCQIADDYNADFPTDKIPWEGGRHPVAERPFPC